MSARQGIHTDDLAPSGGNAAFAYERAREACQDCGEQPPCRCQREAEQHNDAADTRANQYKAIVALQGQVRELEAALTAAHDALTAVERNDLTERYGYHAGEGPIRNRDGETAPPGRRWFTPREIATQAKREIEAALTPTEGE